MSTNPLIEAHALGQSIWLDFIRRHLIESGDLAKMIEDDGLCGVTSNPAIFEKAIAGSHDYDEAIERLARAGKDVHEIYETLTVEDVQRAADVMRPVYDKTDGRDGFVSLEVAPTLAHDTGGTVAEAKRLWAALDRPNVLIKVPATKEGLPAIRALLGAGINVNVTLLFATKRYEEVCEAYLSGLEDRLAAGGAIDRVASVASYFLSRIDVVVDPVLEQTMHEGGKNAALAESLHGQVAIDCAKVAYARYQDIYAGERFAKLSENGARTQRLLWASTSTKNPAYSDVKYVEALIGEDTVNTIPLETLRAFRDHGHAEAHLTDGADGAAAALERLPELGIDLEEVTLRRLVDEGVEKFERPFASLMETLGKARAAALEGRRDRQTRVLSGQAKKVDARVAALEKEGFVRRMWEKDPTVWKDDAAAAKIIRNALGWLSVPEKVLARAGELEAIRDELRRAGYTHVVHMGMGGSSLAPMVLSRTLGTSGGGLDLTVLDTTDPATILSLEASLPLERTAFVVASKSGTTTEPNAFADYFYAALTKRLGKPEAAGEHFLAITDPGTALVGLARERHYRKVLVNYADIGGRYSALSFFGMLPSALAGHDVRALLERALVMQHACESCVPVHENPGALLGATLGELALGGRDKLTFLTPEPLSTLGMWLEQLVAESTGKEGRGILPVAGEPVGPPAAYGDDRVFVLFELEGEVDESLRKSAFALRDAGHPLMTITLGDRLDVAQEFFRWEIATATAGAVLGIDAFDQPNVQESKDNTRRLLEGAKKTGTLAEPAPDLEADGLGFFGGKGKTGAARLASLLGEAKAGDYVAIMAYLTEETDTDVALEKVRRKVMTKLHLATTVGYGPRFLHSTGQLHKGGPDTGVFLQLTVGDRKDAPLPGERFGFSTLRRSQYLGDLEALRSHGRRVMRVHLGDDAATGLATLSELVDRALSEVAK